MKGENRTHTMKAAESERERERERERGERERFSKRDQPQGLAAEDKK